MNRYDEANVILTERFGRDSIISVATIDGARPYVRNVNAYYENGVFYIITYALSNKMNQIKGNPEVAVCGEWFTAHGIGENLGHVCTENNIAMLERLREIFSAWYGNGHVDETDPNTCLLCVRLTDGLLFNHGERYEINFTNHST